MKDSRTQTIINALMHNWISLYGVFLYGIATNVGKLTKKSNTIFRTENKPCFEYRWPTTRHHTTSNAILSCFTLLHDPYKHKLFTPFQQLDHCNVHHGFCTLNHMIFVWNPPQKIDCPQLKHVQNTSMTLHMLDTHSVYRLEIPSLGISIHHWDICSAKIQCLGADAICGFLQFVIIPITCRLERHRPLGKNRRGSTSKLFRAYLQDLEDNVSDALKHLGQSMDEVQCKLQNLLCYYQVTLVCNLPQH